MKLGGKLADFRNFGSQISQKKEIRKGDIGRYREISRNIGRYREISEEFFYLSGSFLPLAGDREVTPEIESLPIKSGRLEFMV